jgi:hypothetical protein
MLYAVRCMLLVARCMLHTQHEASDDVGCALLHLLRRCERPHALLIVTVVIP